MKADKSLVKTFTDRKSIIKYPYSNGDRTTSRLRPFYLDKAGTRFIRIAISKDQTNTYSISETGKLRV